MKYEELKTYSVEELQERIQSEKERLQKLKFAHAVAPIENPTKIGAGRRQVAQLMTALREKQLEMVQEKCQELLPQGAALPKKEFLSLIEKIRDEFGFTVSAKFIAQLAKKFKIEGFARKK
ncbi:MAG: 50S ribosomal protein L29 [Microscillaceae bacterium]|nr:50S ribosomal protein L29 [Microscillaceae bacterium]